MGAINHRQDLSWERWYLWSWGGRCGTTVASEPSGAAPEYPGTRCAPHLTVEKQSGATKSKRHKLTTCLMPVRLLYMEKLQRSANFFFPHHMMPYI